MRGETDGSSDKRASQRDLSGAATRHSTRATWTRSASCSTNTSSGTTAAAAGSATTPMVSTRRSAFSWSWCKPRGDIPPGHPRHRRQRRPCHCVGHVAPGGWRRQVRGLGFTRRAHEGRQGDQVVVLRVEPVPAGRALPGLTSRTYRPATEKSRTFLRVQMRLGGRNLAHSGVLLLDQSRRIGCNLLPVTVSASPCNCVAHTRDNSPRGGGTRPPVHALWRPQQPRIHSAALRKR